jgi:hypothetical protein
MLTRTYVASACVAARPIGEAIDPLGRRVRLDELAVQHILAEHPEMQAHIGRVLRLIAHPDMIEPDPWPGRERYYRRGAGPSSWLFAVVDFETDPPRVVTAYGRRKGP